MKAWPAIAIRGNPEVHWIVKETLWCLEHAVVLFSGFVRCAANWALRVMTSRRRSRDVEDEKMLPGRMHVSPTAESEMQSTPMQSMQPWRSPFSLCSSPTSVSPLPVYQTDNTPTLVNVSPKERFVAAVRSVIMQRADNPRPSRTRMSSMASLDASLQYDAVEVFPSRADLIPALKSLTPSQDLNPHQDLVEHLQFSPDGKYLATCRFVVPHEWMHSFKTAVNLIVDCNSVCYSGDQTCVIFNVAVRLVYWDVK